MDLISSPSIETPDIHNSFCHGSFRIDDSSNFTQPQRADIAIAAYRWNTFLGYGYFSVKDDGKCPVLKQDLDATLIAEFDQQYPSISMDIPLLIQSNWASDTKFQVVVMHEMGHSIGMRHVDAGPHGAIMGRDTNTASDDFTEADKQECRRIGFCD